MARLSGLASEHHLQGPGDTPRRRRGRKPRVSSSDPPSSSMGTKRAASQDAEEIVVIKPKKAKRVQIDDDEDQISQEMEDAASRSQASDTIHVVSEHRSHRRRHSEPLANPIDEDEHNTESTPPPATQPIHGLTPHLSRIGAELQTKNPRRARMSMPAQFHITDVEEVERPREVQFVPLTTVLDSRVKRRLRRSHLSEEVNDIEHHKKDDAKLRKAYADVRRQLRDMEQKYADLTLELEASRLGNIDVAEDQHEEYQEKLEDELQEAREVINKLRASSIFDTESRDVSEFRSTADDEDKENMDDYEQVLLVEPEDLNITSEQMQLEPLPNGYYATHAIESSQVVHSQVTYESLATIPETSQDSILEPSQIEFDVSSERTSSQSTQRFENEIASLTTQLSQARGALRIVTIKLQNMNITHPGATANVIITELQRALDHVLIEYKRLRPGQTTDMTSSDVLYKMIGAMKDMNNELLEKVAVAEKYHRLTHYLRQQNESLLDLQADTEAERAELDQLVEQLKASNDQKAREIEDLDERISTLTQTVDIQDKTIHQHDNTITGLRTELAEAGVDKDRLSQSLQGYRLELEKMTQTVTRLEDEHATQIIDLAQEHTGELNELQTTLANETEARLAAEEDAAEKENLINDLESRVEQMDKELQEFTSDLETLRERYDDETATRAAVEAERDDYANTLYTRENEIENQTEIIQDLQNQITEFRENLGTERAQRERTEADLEDANERIDDLDARLRDAGIQANELRSKLFQVQQEKEETTAQLKSQAEADAASYEEDLDVATQRYDVAEDRISQLDADVVRLTQDLVSTEDTLSELTRSHDALQAERDTLVAKLERQLEELRKKYAALEATSKSTIESLQATITDLTNEVRSLRATIVEQEDAAAEAERLHEETIAERDAIIADKEAAIEILQEENEKLLAEKSSLASRVENEALELLNIMGSHDQIRRSLDDTIRIQKGTINKLQADLQQLQQDNDAEIVVKNSEIEQLKIVSSARVETIISLEAELEDLKERFREQAEDSQRTIDALVATNQEALARQEQLAFEAQKRTRTALASIAEMKVRGIEVKTNGVNLKKVVHGKVTKVSDNVLINKKTRGRKANKPRDSGFVELLSDADYEPSASEVESAIAA